MNTNIVVGVTLLLVGIAVQLTYLLKVVFTKDLKARYELINNYELRTLRIFSTLTVVAIQFLFVLNLDGPGAGVAILGKMVIAIGSTAIVIISLHYFFKVYYPMFIEKRLKVLRYTPRKSPKTGLPMVLLQESEEDAYLDESMIQNENLHSVDYDVWIDESSGYVQIEKYYGYRHALECPDCGYQTMFISKEEIVKLPTPKASGLLVKHYQCRYCNHREQKKMTLRESGTLQASVIRG